MNKDASAHLDPTSASPSSASDTLAPKPLPSDIPLRRCNICMANLPVSAFSYTKYRSDGLSRNCKECHSQRFRLQRRDLYNAKLKGDKDDSFIRSVKVSNTKILQQVLSTNKMELAGYDYVKGDIYKVVYGPSEKMSIISLCMFTKDGNVLVELGLSGVNDPLEKLMGHLKLYNIRLELTEADVLLVKTLIYYV